MVTGAARGLGKAIAERLAECSAAVLAVDLREDVGFDVPDGAASRWERFVADLSDRQQAESAVAATIARFGRIDVLVNCAGGSRRPSDSSDGVERERSERLSAVELSEADLDEAFAINVKSSFFCAVAAAADMIPRGSGSIINVTSRYATIPSVGRLPYGVAKAGVSSLTLTLAKEWGPAGIRVNEISPYARTDATAWRLDSPAERERLLADIALARVAEPYEVAGAAVFLASRLSTYVTGQTITANGGRFG